MAKRVWKKHLKENLINKSRVKMKASRTELNGGLFGINTVLKAHNSHSQQQQQIVKCSFAIKISPSIACHKFGFLLVSCSANRIFYFNGEKDNTSVLSLSQNMSFQCITYMTHINTSVSSSYIKCIIYK